MHVTGNAGKTQAVKIYHFWITSSPFFETVLLTANGPHSLASDSEFNNNEFKSTLRFYDADGGCVNQVEVSSVSQQPSLLELEPFMAACKFESGLKHAHLEIESHPEVKHLCRYQSTEGACISLEPLMLQNGHRTFFPLTLARDRSSFLCFVNCGTNEASIRGRFFCGKRSPEVSWHIPPQGSRLVSVLSEFSEYVDMKENEHIPAYIRIGVRSESPVGVQLIERLHGIKESNFLFTLS